MSHQNILTFRTKIIDTPHGIAIKPPVIKPRHINQLENNLGNLAPLRANQVLKDLKSPNGLIYLNKIETPLICVKCGFISEFSLVY